MQETWFKDWFNSSYYHLLYFNRDDREAAGLDMRSSGRRVYAVVGAIANKDPLKHTALLIARD